MMLLGLIARILPIGRCYATRFWCRRSNQSGLNAKETQADMTQDAWLHVDALAMSTICSLVTDDVYMWIMHERTSHSMWESLCDMVDIPHADIIVETPLVRVRSRSRTHRDVVCWHVHAVHRQERSSLVFTLGLHFVHG